MELDYFKGSSASEKTIRLTPYFFYHVPKAGGTTIKVSVEACFRLIKKIQSPAVQKKLDIFICDRYDERDILTPDAVCALDCLFVASHLPFGVHKKFVNVADFRCITVLREPWSRAKSAYFYSMMRASEPPSQAGFTAFLEKEENCNVMTKQLAGRLPEHPISAHDFEQACQNLTAHFHAFGTLEDIPAITSDVLSSNAFPNVVAERINPTNPKYKLDCSESEQFWTRNEWDRRLYDFVKSKRRIPAQPDTPPHPYSVVMRETGDDSKSTYSAAVVPTQTFSASIKDGKVPAHALEPTEPRP